MKIKIFKLNQISEVRKSHPCDNWGPPGGLLGLNIASYDDLIVPMGFLMGGSDGIGGIGSLRSGGDAKSPLPPRPPGMSIPRDAPTG